VKTNGDTNQNFFMINFFQRQTKFNKRSSFRLGAIALGAMAVVLPACSEAPDGTTSELETETGVVEENATAEEIAENTDAFIGQSVSARGEVESIVGEQSFTISTEDFGTEPILVLNATGTPFVTPPEDDIEVQATGEVRQLILAEIERDYDLGLDPEIYAEFEEQPVIIAESLSLAPDPGEVTQYPELFYGQNIAVEGEVEEFYADGAFTLDEEQFAGASDLLVIDAATGQVVNEDSDIVVVGTVRPFVTAELERDYDLTWDLDIQEQLEAEYTDQPVLIAQEVYPSAE
jgi:predicted acyltransferase (DUF342 family)